MTNAEARFSNSLRPRKPEGSLGRTAQDGHLDSHTAPELLKVDCYRIGKHTVCRRVRASLSPEIVQAEAVKGFITVCIYSHTQQNVRAGDAGVSMYGRCRHGRGSYGRGVAATCPAPRFLAQLLPRTTSSHKTGRLFQN